MDYKMCQPTYNVIKYINNSNYVIRWRSKEVYNTKLLPIKNDSLLNMKYLNEKYYYNLIIVL